MTQMRADFRSVARVGGAARPPAHNAYSVYPSSVGAFRGDPSVVAAAAKDRSQSSFDPTLRARRGGVVMEADRASRPIRGIVSNLAFDFAGQRDYVPSVALRHLRNRLALL